MQYHWWMLCLVTKTLSISQIYRVIKAVKEGKTTSDRDHLQPKKMKWTCNVVASTTAAVKKDQQMIVHEPATAHDLTSR